MQGTRCWEGRAHPPDHARPVPGRLSLGRRVVRTPNLDGQGVLLTRHYNQAAPCSPGRACLYTGTYQMTDRVVGNGMPLDHRFDTVALAARRAGYRPTLFGYTDQGIDPRSATGGRPAAVDLRGDRAGFRGRTAAHRPPGALDRMAPRTRLRPPRLLRGAVHRAGAAGRARRHGLLDRPGARVAPRAERTLVGPRQLPAPP